MFPSSATLRVIRANPFDFECTTAIGSEDFIQDRLDAIMGNTLYIVSWRTMGRLHSLHQKTSIHAYATALRDIFLQIEVAGGERIDRFICGLRSQETRKLVFMQAPKTFDHAVQLATTLDALDSATTPPDKSVRRLHSIQKHKPFKQFSGSCWYCKQSGHKFSDCRHRPKDWVPHRSRRSSERSDCMLRPFAETV